MRDIPVPGIDQRTGFREKLSDLKREPRTGFLVKRPDKIHPQEFVRGVKDRQALNRPSPEPADVFLPPPLSAYHLDFQHNQAWQSTTQLGTASQLLSGSLRLTSDGLEVQSGDVYTFAASILTLAATKIGSVVVTGYAVTTSSGRLIGIDGGRSLIHRSSTGANSTSSFNGSVSLRANSGSGSFATAFKVAVGFNAAGRSLVFNYGTVYSDTSTIGAAAVLGVYLGSDFGLVQENYGVGFYHSCTWYDTRLPDISLQLATVI